MIFRYKPLGSREKSQSDDDAADSLGEIAGQYQQLIGGSRDGQSMTPAQITAKEKRFVWTRVLSMEGFSIAGCSEHRLYDDLIEAQQELDGMNGTDTQAWELLFDPNDHELPRGTIISDEHRLSTANLESIGS